MWSVFATMKRPKKAGGIERDDQALIGNDTMRINIGDQ
jgi:hypothetical protein